RSLRDRFYPRHNRRHLFSARGLGGTQNDPSRYNAELWGAGATVGPPKSGRAVGVANAANPVAIVVPCHRVIGSDGSLTGYGGGISRIRWLLLHEGVALEKFCDPTHSRHLVASAEDGDRPKRFKASNVSRVAGE